MEKSWSQKIKSCQKVSKMERDLKLVKCESIANVNDLGKTTLSVRDAAKDLNGVLLKLYNPKSVMIICKLGDQRIISFIKEMIKKLVHSHNEFQGLIV
jgi:hypothetical protein